MLSQAGGPTLQTVPEAGGLSHLTEIDADLAAVLSPGAAAPVPELPSEGSGDASGGLRGPPGAGKQTRSSGLQWIC